MDKSNTPQRHNTARLAGKLRRGFEFTLAAFAIGSQWVPLADNRQLVRELAAQASRLNGEST